MVYSLYDGRRNTIGHAVAYRSTSPSLCALEKLVHVEDPDLLPALAMVRYDVPDSPAIQRIEVVELPADWRQQEGLTQQVGDDWHASSAAPLLQVPSAIVPIDDSPDVNMAVNHRHPLIVQIRPVDPQPFVLDSRLF